MITVTSLTHPLMIAKLRQAMQESSEQGYPAYITNRKGRTIIRVGYSRRDGFTVYAGGSRDITRTVRRAFLRARSQTFEV